MDLAQQSAIVTGASSGIGRATARKLAEAGARVGIAARTESKLATLADELEQAGGEALAIPTDVTDRDQVEAMIETVRDAFGGLDVVVNSAGVGHWEHTGIVDGDLDAWRREIDVNLLGTMYGTHFAASVMVEEGTGTIVNVGSGAGRYAGPDWPGYVASKFGVNGFTESAVRDLRRQGIRVTHVLPGQVKTPMQPEEELESTRMLEPEDVAKAIIYAVSQPAHVCLNELMIVPVPRSAEAD